MPAPITRDPLDGLQVFLFRMATKRFADLDSYDKESFEEAFEGIRSFAEPVPAFDHSKNSPLITLVIDDNGHVVRLAVGHKGYPGGTGLRQIQLTSVETVKPFPASLLPRKVDATDATRQVRRYPARWHVLLTSAGANTAGTGIRHVHWIRLVECLTKAAASSSPEYRFLAKQLIAYLEEHHMVKSTESVEIYAREINEPVTLALFIQGHIYGCNYEKNQKVTRAQYFAPHFGARLSRHQPGIFHGISYVARIEKIFIAAPWNEFVDGVCAARGKLWWNSHAEIMKRLHAEKDWDWSGEQKRNFLLLGEPRLAFNPPIKKERLQSGKGWLNRRFFSFDELFAAWGR